MSVCAYTLDLRRVYAHCHKAACRRGARNKNISKNEDEEESPRDLICMEDSYQDAGCHDHDLVNICEAICQVYQAIDEGRPYAGIDTYLAAIGKRVVRVFAEKPERGEVFCNMDLPASRHENCYRQTLYFMYDGGMPILAQYADLRTDKVLPEKTLIDVSEVSPVLWAQPSKISALVTMR